MIGNWFDAMGQFTAERVINALLIIAVGIVCVIVGAILGGLFGRIMA